MSFSVRLTGKTFGVLRAVPSQSLRSHLYLFTEASEEFDYMKTTHFTESEWVPPGLSDLVRVPPLPTVAELE